MATAPVHSIDAPIRGSGKTKIVDIACILATGECAITFAQGETLEEFEKRLSVQLMMGRQIIVPDNCTHNLEGNLINQATTQLRVDLRILGQSKSIVAHCAAVIAPTGNNIRVVDDLTRRALISRLDPGVDRPELRQFDYDPIADARENRGELVAAALTLLKAYWAAGRPGRPPRLQSFEDWSDTVRGAIIWIGMADPVDTQERLRENDPKLEKLIRTATVWREAFGLCETTVAEAVEKASEQRRVGEYGNEKFERINPDLFDALMAIGRRGSAINPEAVGRYLSSEAERVVRLESGELGPVFS
jgi:hypothetical protein